MKETVALFCRFTIGRLSMYRLRLLRLLRDRRNRIFLSFMVLDGAPKRVGRAGCFLRIREIDVIHLKPDGLWQRINEYLFGQKTKTMLAAQRLDFVHEFTWFTITNLADLY